MPRTIRRAVGIGGVNRANDTTTVQELLNQVPRECGGPDPVLLKVDGLCGPKTKRAIQNFQRKQFREWRRPDGRVDPAKQTLAKLNEFDKPAVPISIPVDAHLITLIVEGRHVRPGHDQNSVRQAMGVANQIWAPDIRFVLRSDAPVAVAPPGNAEVVDPSVFMFLAGRFPARGGISLLLVHRLINEKDEQNGGWVAENESASKSGVSVVWEDASNTL